MEQTDKSQEATAPTVRVNNKLYYGVAGAAAALGISAHTLRREISRKNIRNLRHSCRILFLPEWLDEWVDRNTVKPARK